MTHQHTALAAVGLSVCLAAGSARAQMDGGVVGPRFGAELDVDMSVLTGAVGDQSDSAGAWDGQVLLVAWRTPLWRSELRVARVDGGGRVLDPRGVRLDGFERDQGTVAVAAGGGVFMVAWSQDPNQTFVAPVTAPGGRLSLGKPVVVDAGPTGVLTWGPAVAWNGTSFWVVWSHSDAAAGVYAARVGTDGAVIDRTPIRLAADPGQVAVGAGADGAGDAGAASPVLIAWAGGAVAPAVRAVRLDADGHVLDPAALAVLDLPAAAASDTTEPPSVTWGGGAYLVSAAGLHADGTAELRAGRVAADGRLLDGAGAGLVLGTTAGALAGGPTAVWSGAGFSVLWAADTIEDGKHVFHLAGRTVADGGPGPLPATWQGLARRPVLVPTAGDPILLYSQVETRTDDGAPADADIRSARLGAAGLGPSTLVSEGTNDEAEPVVALGGDRLLVAWEDRREDRAGADIYAARVDERTGAGLDGTGLAVATGPAAQHTPAVAWDGQSFLVVWHEGDHGLGAARVTAAGEVLDRPPRVVPGTAGQTLLSNPVACADGDGVLLAWAAQQGGAGELRGLRVPPGATVSDGTSFSLTATRPKDLPPIMRMGCNPHGAVLAFSANLAATDMVPLYLAHLARGAAAFSAPGPRALQMIEGDEWAGIGSDGQDFLVAWRNFDGLGRRRVVAVRVTGDGRLLDDVPRTIGRSNSGQRVNALWDGEEYLVLAINTMADDPFELRGHRVSRALDVLEGDWFTVNPVARDIGDTGTGSDGVYLGDGRAYLVYDRFFDPDGTGSKRVRGRFVSPAPAAPADAGAPPDAAPDALSDAGPAVATSGRAGCGCGLAPRPPGAAAVAVAVAAGWLTRRRRRGSGERARARESCTALVRRGVRPRGGR